MMKPHTDRAEILISAITKELAALITTPLELVHKELGFGKLYAAGSWVSEKVGMDASKMCKDIEDMNMLSMPANNLIVYWGGLISDTQSKLVVDLKQVVHRTVEGIVHGDPSDLNQNS